MNTSGREHAAASAPVFHLGLCLLLGVLVLVALSYFDVGVSGTSAVPAMLGPFAIAAWSPVLGVALVFAAAPLTDPIAAYFFAGSPLSRGTGGLVWVEPMFLGVAAGITARLLGRSRRPRTVPPAAWFYAAVVLCAFGVQLAGYADRWQGLAKHPLETLWSSVPDPRPLSPEHTLRAALLFLIGPLWLWLARNTFGESRRDRTVWLAWLVGAFVVNACAIAMWIQGLGFSKERFMGLLDDPNSYASYLVLTVFVAWVVLRSERRPLVRALAAVAMVSSACMIALSGSKIGILAALGGATIAALGTQERGWRRIAIAGIIVTTLWAGAMFAARYVPSDIGRVSDPSYLLRYTKENRWAVWSASARAFASHPAAGIGPGLLCRSLGDYYRPEDQGWRPKVENAHNYFLQLAAETGLFGLLGFVWMVAASLLPALTDRRSRDGRSRLLAIGALSYLATLLTGNALLLSRQTILFWGFVGVLSAPYESAPASRLARRGAWLALPLFLAALWLDPAPHECQRDRQRKPVGWEFGLGFHYPEGAAGSRQRWMKDAGELQICNRTDRPLVADVTLTVQSFDESRALLVYSGDQPLADLSVGPNPETITVPGVPLARGPTPLLFVASPGARPVDEVLHDGQRRRLSVLFVGKPTFSLTVP